MIELDWNAPIIPKYSMLGLTLGMSKNEILNILKQNIIEDNTIYPNRIFTIKLQNGPELIVAEHEYRFYFIDKKLIELFGVNPNNEVAGLGFNVNHLLTNITVRGNTESRNYLGKFEKTIGLGSNPRELLKTGEWEFDDGNELFYSTDNQYNGVEFGGIGSIDQMPDQTIGFIIVFSK